jgi:hypothetical protein
MLRTILIIVLCLVALFIYRSFRAPDRDTVDMNLCLNNLRAIHLAKKQYSQEFHLTNGDNISVDLLRNRFPSNQVPKCPRGGVYTVGKIGQKPSCSIHGETWEE